jgi:hypothetical protein
MREILGRRRMNWSSPRNAALHCATQWEWPVLPGATLTLPSPSVQPSKQPPPPAPSTSASTPSSPPALPVRQTRTPTCACHDPACVVPGAHPLDPVLLAATTDARMVGWWWTQTPTAPLILATGSRGGPSALSLPAVAGARALAAFDRAGVRLGPVVATPTRFTLLVAPYELEELGDRLYAYDWVPSSLRFHGDGGYVALPPSQTGTGRVRWERQPPTRGVPWLPRMTSVLDVLVEASAAAPESGSSLTY